VGTPSTAVAVHSVQARKGPLRRVAPWVQGVVTTSSPSTKHARGALPRPHLA
jgi:hypothetical protein